MLSPIRRALKRWHPEGIPWPGSVLYNAVSATHVFQRHYELIAQDVVGHCRAGCILDVGTGPGWLLEKLYRASSRLRMTGLDVSPSLVEKARENMKRAELAGVVSVVEGRSDDIPFADCSFDAVISTGSIHHWKDPISGLNEAYRVLKQGGYALIYDLVSDTPGSVIARARREFGRLRMLLLWLHAFEEPFYSHEDFHLLARSTLFEHVQSRFIGVMLCLVLRRP